MQLIGKYTVPILLVLLGGSCIVPLPLDAQLHFDAFACIWLLLKGFSYRRANKGNCVVLFSEKGELDL